MISETTEKRIQFNDGIIPDNFEDLIEICPIDDIFDEGHYERAINISGKLISIENMTDGQIKYLDKISDYIIDYENKVFDF